jgi:hypothetical protein
MKGSTLDQHFAKITGAMSTVAPFSIELPKDALTMERYCNWTISLEDWQIALQRFDADSALLVELNKKLAPWRKSGRVWTVEEKQLHDELFETGSRLRFDIRCIYIFAKICVVHYMQLLSLIAGEKGQDLVMPSFIKSIRRDGAPDLLRRFDHGFRIELEWFHAHVNWYRDDFVEHSTVIPHLHLGGSPLRIKGLTRIDLDIKEVAFLQQLQQELKQDFPDFATKAGVDRYNWLCRHLEVIPEHHRRAARSMIRRVGRESGDLNEVVPRIAMMLAGFVSFFQQWRDTH